MGWFGGGDEDTRSPRARWDDAIRRDRPEEALEALRALEATDPRGVWSHRVGDALRRLGRHEDAAEVYVVAVQRYAAEGFLARAIAMAKVAELVAPSRTGLLAQIRHWTAEVPPPVSLVQRAHVLEPARDAAADEVLFDDAPDGQTANDVGFHERDITPDAPTEDGVPVAERLAFMSGSRMLASLSHDALAELAAAADLLELAAGEVLLRRNEPADALFVIVEGEAHATFPGSGAPLVLQEGDVFGESCLLDDGARQADVTATQPLVAMRIPKARLDEILARHPDAEDVLFRLLVRRLLATTLATSELFSPLDAAVRAQIAAQFEVRRARRGTVLSMRGLRADGLYVLIAGHIDVKGEGLSTWRLGRGSVSGQHSLVRREPAIYTLRAESEALVLRLGAARFAQLVHRYPAIHDQLSLLATRPPAASHWPHGLS